MNKARTLVIGDIHGGYKALLQVLDRAVITHKDTLIFLGDYVDGWSQTPEVLSHLIALSKTHHCIFLRGNHDDLLLDWLKHESISSTWFKHGGEASMQAYEKVSDETKKEHIDFLSKLENYYLDDQNRLFLHAGFTHLKGIDYEYHESLFYWDRTLWEMALSLNPEINADSPLYPARLKNYSEIYIGHTPTLRISQTKPVNAANVWNLDTGAGFDGALTIMNIDTKEFWQSDTLDSIYKEEGARKKHW